MAEGAGMDRLAADVRATQDIPKVTSKGVLGSDFGKVCDTSAVNALKKVQEDIPNSFETNLILHLQEVDSGKIEGVTTENLPKVSKAFPDELKKLYEAYIGTGQDRAEGDILQHLRQAFASNIVSNFENAGRSRASNN